MNELVFFLEEPSAKVMLEGFLPKILPDNVNCRYVVFEGKQDLEKNIIKRISGYLVPGARFIILRDQDAADCKIIKKSLAEKCAEAKRSGILIRIACRELESWYLADLIAVGKGLGLPGITKHQNKRQFLSPDGYPSPARTLQRIAPSYQKVGGSRSIGPHLNPDNKRSRSFAVFVAGIRKMCVSN